MAPSNIVVLREISSFTYMLKKTLYFERNNAAEKVGPDGIVDVLAFSRGNILVRNALNAWRRSGNQYGKRVHLTSIGSPVIFDIKLAENIFQVMSSRDGVTLLSGWRRFCPPSHVKIVKSDGMYFTDHKFTNKIYSDARNEFIGRIKDRI